MAETAAKPKRLTKLEKEEKTLDIQIKQRSMEENAVKLEIDFLRCHNEKIDRVIRALDSCTLESTDGLSEPKFLPILTGEDREAAKAKLMQLIAEY